MLIIFVGAFAFAMWSATWLIRERRQLDDNYRRTALELADLKVRHQRAQAPAGCSRSESGDLGRAGRSTNLPRHVAGKYIGTSGPAAIRCIWNMVEPAIRPEL